MPETYRKEINKVLGHILAERERVVLVGEDLRDPYGGAFKVTEGLSHRFSDRVINMPISEGLFVGLASGLCVTGMKAIVEIMFSDFLTLCADQVVNHASKFNDMYGLGKDVFSVMVRTPSGGGRGYGATHSQSLETLYMGLPGVGVYAPTVFHNIGALYRRVIDESNVSLVVESKLDYPRPLVECPYHQGEDGYGYSVVYNELFEKRPNVTVLTYGPAAYNAVQVVLGLSEAGVGAEALIPEKIAPLDYAPIVEHVSETGNLVIVSEGYKSFGWGEAVAGYLCQHHFEVLENRVEIIGAENQTIPSSPALESSVVPDQESIKRRVLSYLA